MIPCVFVDTNVLLDFLADRKEHIEHAARIWALAEHGHIEAFVSAISYNNVYYVLRKSVGHAEALRSLSDLRTVFAPVALDEQILNRAIDAALDDFEDGIQYYSAMRAKASCIVTRNPGHFPKSDGMPVLSPAEFLAGRKTT
jgi:predicted nucleic acid-binding protein